MAIATGEALPNATLIKMGEDGPEEVKVADITAGRKVVIFAVPGAFTPTCHAQHVPSYIATKDALMAKGVDEIICLSVNDPFVMKAWGEATGAAEAGLTMLSDAQSEFTTAIGMNFDAPPVGLMARSQRYAMLVDNGTVSVMNLEDAPGAFDVSSGEKMLEALA